MDSDSREQLDPYLVISGVGSLCYIVFIVSVLILGGYSTAHQPSIDTGLRVSAGIAFALVSTIPYAFQLIRRKRESQSEVKQVVGLSPSVPIGAIYAIIFVAGLYAAQQNVTFARVPQIQIKVDIRFQGNSVLQTAQNLSSTVDMAFYAMIISSFGLANGLPMVLILAVIIAIIALVVDQALVKSEIMMAENN